MAPRIEKKPAHKRAKSEMYECNFCLTRDIPYYTFHRRHRNGDCLRVHSSTEICEDEVGSSRDVGTAQCVEGRGGYCVEGGISSGSGDCRYDLGDVSIDNEHATTHIVDSSWVQRYGPFYTGTAAVAVSATAYDISEGLQDKIRDGVSRDTANSMLTLLRRVAGADSSKFLPTSVTNLESMMNVPSLDRFSVRYCEKCCHVLSSAQRHQRVNTQEGCPTCRRLGNSAGGTTVTESNGWAFYLGVDNAIQTLFANDEFRLNRGRHRTFRDPSTQWGSKAWMKIDSNLRRMPLTDEEGNAITHVGLFHPSASPYSIFVDSYSPTETGNLSVCIAFLRCEDLDAETRSHSHNCVPLLIIPGKPRDISGFMELIANDFRRLLSRPLRVNDSNCSGTDLCHWPVLVGVDADFPAGQATLGYARGNGGYFSCPHCKGTAVAMEDGGRTTIRHSGFTTAVKINERTIHGGEMYQLGIQDERRRYNNESNMARCIAAEDELKRLLDGCKGLDDRWKKTSSIASKFGVVGRNPFAKSLEYLDSTIFWRVGTFHLLFLGLVKAFWRGLVFNTEAPVHGITLAKDKITQVDKLLSGVEVTRDFNRPFRGLGTINTWLCEDWKRWVEVYSVFAFHSKFSPIQLPPLARKMWGHLRRFVLHHTSTDRSHYHRSVRMARQQDILLYGALIETHCPRLLTINLHRAACHMAHQEEMLGLLGHCSEFWGERGIRTLKRITGDRPNGEVVKSLCNKILHSMALSAFVTKHGLSMQSWGEGMGADFSAWRAGYDLAGMQEGISAMQGLEKEATYTQRIEIEAALRCAAGIRDGKRGRPIACSVITPGQYSEIMAGTPRFLVHSYAVINGCQTITSRQFGLEEKRKTNVVKVTYQNEIYIAEVLYFVRAQYSTEGTVRENRFAMCNLFDMTYSTTQTDPDEDYDVGHIFCVKRQQASHGNDAGQLLFEFKRQLWPVLLEDISGPVASCRRSAPRGNYDLMSFVDYNFSSNRG